MKSLVFGLLLLVANLAYAAPSGDASVAFTKAKQAWKQEEYAAAITQLNRAISLEDEPAFYHYLARCYAKIEQPKKALDAALEFLFLVGQKSEKTKEYGKRLSEARTLVQQLRAQLRPGDIEVSIVDCADPSITLDGDQPRSIGSLQIRPKPGKSQHIKLQCLQAPRPAQEPNGWAKAYPWLLGSGAAMGVGAATAWVLWNDLVDSVDENSAGKKQVDQVNAGPIRTLAVGATVGAVVLLSVGGAAWWFADESAPWVAPTPNGLTLGGRF